MSIAFSGGFIERSAEVPASWISVEVAYSLRIFSVSIFPPHLVTIAAYLREVRVGEGAAGGERGGGRAAERVSASRRTLFFKRAPVPTRALRALRAAPSIATAGAKGGALFV